MHEFDLIDADGNSHHYVVNLHPGMEGFRIVARLAELGAEPIARLASQAMAAEGVLDALQLAVRGDPAANAKLSAVSSKLDFGAAAKELRPLLADSPDLVMRILAHTQRDRALPGQPSSMVAFKGKDGQTWFDAAYAGNYGEMLAACWKVVALNRFFPWPATSIKSA